VTEWQAVAHPVLALAVNCAIFLGLQRAFGSRLSLSILAGLGLGLATSFGLALESLRPPDVSPEESLICQIGTYLGLSFCFWAFLNLNITSLRIRMIRQLLLSNGALAISDLLASYPDSERFQRRLTRLKNSRQIALIDGKWRLQSSTLLILARGIDLVRTIMGTKINS
jgi:hypothetical protein